jgi:hypothetical protein
LLPTYALASIPAAQGLLWVAGFLARSWRMLWLTTVAGMLAVQLVSQVVILERNVCARTKSYPAAVHLGGAGRS